VIVSVVIRTFNEQKFLKELLTRISRQKSKHTIEVVIVDSGSTDSTLDIVSQFETILVHIKKQDFTFGRSLNYGCKAANGDYIVFISGHCLPVDENWIEELVAPFENDEVAMTYGRQIGTDETKFSEHQIFQKYYPDYDKIPQEGYFSNNANSAIRKALWKEKQFNEELTGLEDMYWSKQMWKNGYKVAYCSRASVYHIHQESWSQVKRRYEREAIALQRIMPEVHVSFFDFIRYVSAGVFSDMAKAIEEKKFFRNAKSIILFRICQFYGAYLGNHEHRKLSKKRKEKYFYPTK
jgi:rhamnosyltransferase